MFKTDGRIRDPSCNDRSAVTIYHYNCPGKKRTMKMNVRRGSGTVLMYGEEHLDEGKKSFDRRRLSQKRRYSHVHLHKCRSH